MVQYVMVETARCAVSDIREKTAQRAVSTMDPFFIIISPFPQFCVPG